MAQATVVPSPPLVPPVLPGPAVGVAGAVVPGFVAVGDAGVTAVGAGVAVAGFGDAVLLGRSDVSGSPAPGPHAVAARRAAQAAAPRA
ncbi:hypothetical protein GCM10018781_16950 [Kitasatospora indigofera]|uniref:Uncharacterized protein n=1 Tax=Kitasatospora indigofera TaxID=67307 RepID=A0A919FHM9_9ACTN|nr:hypothetical protein GCM10018781_16950 [Kitasatospora indigofera]